MRASSILRVVAFSMFAFVHSAVAHPLGNFSISQYSALRVGAQELELRYIVDMAEIPTFQEIQETGLVAKADDPSARPYAAGRAEDLKKGLFLEINGRPLTLRTQSQEIIFPEGAGGLPTLKLGVVYRGKIASGGVLTLNYRDNNFPGRAGWKEVIAVAAPGAKLLNSSVPETDRSAQLSNYPSDLLNTPPQQLTAQVSFSVPPPVANSATREPTTAAVAKMVGKVAQVPNAQLAPIDQPMELKANSQTTPRNAFTEIMARQELGFGIIFAALVIAVGLGAFHALEPGHGKTLVAAYLVGSRGTLKHALILGLIVTASHTAGVYLLGAVTLYASNYIVPERLYPWLATISGLVIALLGLILLVRRYQGKDRTVAHQHDHHEHDHEHHHHGGHNHHHHHHYHDHHHGQHHHGHHHAVSLKQLFALGVSGGIVPCPAALVVLLGAVAMQRIGFGLLLIVGFSVGLAAVLIAIGMLMVFARQFMTRFHAEGPLTTRWLPITSAAFIFLAGVGLTWQALRNGGLLALRL